MIIVITRWNGNRHLKLVEALPPKAPCPRCRAPLHYAIGFEPSARGLEEALGVSLFRRVPRGMILTRAGEKLLDCARWCCHGARCVGARDRRRVRSSGHAAHFHRVLTCYHWLPRALRCSRQVFRECRSRSRRRHATSGRSSSRRRARSRHRLRPAHSGRVTSRPLFEDEMVAILSPEHRLASAAV